MVWVVRTNLKICDDGNNVILNSETSKYFRKIAFTLVANLVLSPVQSIQLIFLIRAEIRRSNLKTYSLNMWSTHTRTSFSALALAACSSREKNWNVARKSQFDEPITRTKTSTKNFNKDHLKRKVTWQLWNRMWLKFNINFDPCLLFQKKTYIFDAATDEILNFLGQFIKASQFKWNYWVTQT